VLTNFLKIPMQTFSVTLEKSYLITPNVKHFVCYTNHEPCFTFLPGQFITIHFNYNDKVIKRSYSIANSPIQNNYIEFAASYVPHGPGSDFLFNLNAGECLEMSGPFGRLVLKGQPKRYILVATGTGITPYRSMLTSLSEDLDANSELKIVILQGVRTAEDILYAEDFLSFQTKHPGQVIYQTYLSRDAELNLAPHQKHGHVHKGLEALNLDLDNDLIYLCGNPLMIDDAFQSLSDKGMPSAHIIREKYISGKS
jgi:ferredoxin-NADP reductase